MTNGYKINQRVLLRIIMRRHENEVERHIIRFSDAHFLWNLYERLDAINFVSPGPTFNCQQMNSH